MRLGGGLQGLMSYALQRANNLEAGATLVNSPGQTAKFRVSAPGPSKRSSVSLEVLAMGSRRTIAGATLGPTTTANVTLLAPIGRFELMAGVRDLFDVRYADPASDAHRQDVIAQNGRTRVSLGWKLWPT
jgi:hypothetical protein